MRLEPNASGRIVRKDTNIECQERVGVKDYLSNVESKTPLGDNDQVNECAGTIND